ncbi:hypothetical protein POPTR_017G148432v4 [Populus trichocarpa]|uniref:Fe/B12 periplasmic-binding domain-containing protein n=1 Tax=Populus trichocarpa TaxID=3694 RepID=A0A2K1X7Q2_POPTR|nr:hypothetical protein POPTR_017G148432v4 [Populus trichocarpa]
MPCLCRLLMFVSQWVSMQGFILFGEHHACTLMSSSSKLKALRAGTQWLCWM